MRINPHVWAALSEIAGGLWGPITQFELLPCDGEHIFVGGYYWGGLSQLRKT